jgi:hypothetical protein
MKALMHISLRYNTCCVHAAKQSDPFIPSTKQNTISDHSHHHPYLFSLPRPLYLWNSRVTMTYMRQYCHRGQWWLWPGDYIDQLWLPMQSQGDHSSWWVRSENNPQLKQKGINLNFYIDCIWRLGVKCVLPMTLELVFKGLPRALEPIWHSFCPVMDLLLGSEIRFLSLQLGLRTN